MKRWLTIAAAALAASCTDTPEEAVQREESWQLRPTRDYFNAQTLEQKAPRELYAYGEKLRDDKRYAEAAAVFGVLADTAPEPGLRSEALFARGHTRMLEGSFDLAYRDFEGYQARYPDGDFATLAKRRMMESALALAKVGQKESILGVPLITSSRGGIDLLKNALQKFPREEFSAEFCYRLAEFYHERGDLDEAEVELKSILSNPTYRRSGSAPRALLLLGRVGLERYDGVDYDHKSLADAKRAYEQFELDYKRYEDDPEKAGELGLKDLASMLATARTGIAFVNEKLAERELALAAYYEKLGHAGAALVYLQGIVRNYPKTRCALEAGREMDRLNREYGPTP